MMQQTDTNKLIRQVLSLVTKELKNLFAHRLAIILFLASFGLSGGPVYADPIIRSAVDSGWYRDFDGVHVSFNENYIVGLSGAADLHNFFVFDLSGITGTFTSAILRLQCPNNCFDGPAGTYTIYEVSTQISDLRAGGTGKFDIYDDLGNGVIFGSVVVSETDENSIITIDLNPNALFAINAANGLYAFGGAFAAIGSSPNHVFAFTSSTFCGGPCLRELVLDTTILLAVDIDIKPGSDPACRGEIPVAILGSDSLDVTQIDPTTLSFEGLDVQVRGSGALSCKVKDTNSDGYADFVCRFQDATTDGTLTGELLDGTVIEGTDIFCVLN